MQCNWQVYMPHLILSITLHAYSIVCYLANNFDILLIVIYQSYLCRWNHLLIKPDTFISRRINSEARNLWFLYLMEYIAIKINISFMFFRCQIAVHQECYGARNVRDFTSWVCKVCETPNIKRECCLCPVKGRPSWTFGMYKIKLIFYL